MTSNGGHVGKQSSWLLIDFDNTMMGTEHLAIPSIVKRFNQLYSAQIGRELTVPEFTEHFAGQARQSLAQNLGQYFGIEVDYDALYDAREWRMMQMLKETEIEMADGLIEALQALRARGFAFAFVSNNPIQRAFAAMRRAKNGRGAELAALFGTAYFEAGDVQKPLPEVYLRALSQLDADPAQSYAIEDSVTGVKSAVAAGLVTFGYLGFAASPDQLAVKLTDHGARSCFSHWSELAALLSVAAV